jgi:hypothetical protein
MLKIGPGINPSPTLFSHQHLETDAISGPIRAILVTARLSSELYRPGVAKESAYRGMLTLIS